jgi:hypothetical protein
VPPGIASLKLSYWYVRAGNLGNFQVLADGQQIGGVPGAPTTWQQQTLDITSYATDGQITLDFKVPSQIGNSHALLFDEITVFTPQ